MIQLEGIEKVFPGAAAPVLRGVSLTIDKGEIFGIIGRSGAGKSTLVRCINMLERPSRGRVVVAGRDMTSLSEADLRQARRGIGMVFQHFNLLSSRTVYDNVALPLELAGKSKAEIAAAVMPLLDLVGLTERRDHYPAQLSGGQKQRVGIARALASQPEVLLCDEATSALDPETTKSILALLKDINSKLGLTIVLITHEMQVIKEIADRVAVIEQGQVIEMGRVFDVFTNPASETTRTFVRDVVNQEMPESLVRRLAEGGPTAPHPVLRVTFTGPAANDPILTELVRRFGLSLNILHAHVDYIQGAPFGSITVEINGADASVQEAVAFLRDNHLKAEILGRVGANPRIAA